MSHDLRRGLAQWGVQFSRPKRVTLHSIGFTAEGELSAASSREVVRQLGATKDTLFQVDLAFDERRLWRAIVTSVVSGDRVLTERNGYLMSIALSLAVPWWEARTGWLVDGLRALRSSVYSPVAWPGEMAVSLHRTPEPVNGVHLTITYRGKE